MKIIPFLSPPGPFIDREVVFCWEMINCYNTIMRISIRKTTPKDMEWIKKIFLKFWKGDFVVAKGRVYKPEVLEGFIAHSGSKKLGLVTYKVSGDELGIISFNSFLKNKGVGTALMKKVIKLARKKALRRIWVSTTNDNLEALKFYQKRGFRIKRVYPDAMDKVRKLKPSIPKIGDNGISLRDEIELEILL